MRISLAALPLLVLSAAPMHSQGTPMTLISPELGRNFEGMRRQLAAASTTPAVVSNSVDVRLVKDQQSSATVRGFTLTQDEPASAGGTASGPTPTDYFVASLGFCENVIFARGASMAGLSIDSLETHVTGSWDRRGLFEIGGVTSAFITITIETKVATHEPVDSVAAVARETHRRCPIYATLSPATTLVFTLLVNGRDVPL